MEYTQRDFEVLGKQVAAGKYVAKQTFILSIVLMFILGIALGRLTAPDLASEGAKERERPFDPASSSFKGADANQQAVQSILTHEEEVRKDPNNAEAWGHLGDLYYDINEPQKAVNAYEKSLALAPGNPNVLVDCGVMYRSLREYEKALSYFTKALALNPKHEIAQYNSGVVLYHDLGKKEEGLAAWRALVRMNPDAKAPNGVLVSAMLKDLEGR